MEILIDNIKNINKEFNFLNSKDWLKIMNTKLNVGIVICRKTDEVLKSMVYNDIATIYLEYEDKTMFYRHHDINLSDLKYYLTTLLDQDNIWCMNYITLIMNRGFRIHDILIFEDNKRGIVLSPKETYRGGIYYRLIKKDGNFGVKELMLSGEKHLKVERIVNKSTLLR